VAAVLGAAVALCVPSLTLLSRIWERFEYYGHGYAIPLVALYLIWRDRAHIAQAFRTGTPPLLGPLVVIAAAGAQFAAILGDAGFLAGAGLPLVLGAIAFGLGGRALLRSIALPLAFLLLMVPPPRFLTYQILFRLKLFVTDVSVGILQTFGTTVAADGNEILLPGAELFVADACSGLTSIVTLLPLAAIVAYFLSHGVWRRALVMASVVPLAVGANILRVVGTVSAVSFWGVDAAQGFLHESFGIWTYLIGTLALLALARVLR
jgi:exosortase